MLIWVNLIYICFTGRVNYTKVIVKIKIQNSSYMQMRLLTEESFDIQDITGVTDICRDVS